MKQNELFNKCCENIDPKTREEVWKQMDKELGREENRGNSSKIPSISPKQTLEQAALDYAFTCVNGIQFFDSQEKLIARSAFKAGAEWQKKQEVDGKALLYVNDHAYKKGFKDGALWQNNQNELTWEDVKQIMSIADMLIVSNEPSKSPSEQRFYEEVADEYNRLKRIESSVQEYEKRKKK